MVERGDTLHAVAWRYRIDFRDLIRWNGLRNPDLIVVGQKLRLSAPPAKKTPKPPQREDKAAPVKQATVATKPVRKPAGKLTWQWPASGKVSVAKGVTGAQGINIRGQRGQSIKAAAPGAVVYSGSGLRGYGELIIIKHSETFLSAYAHNETRLVKEGERVTPGQLIARMGNSEAREVMLHFEIRRDGKTVDPFRYLPRRK